jgi:hypothetical protein
LVLVLVLELLVFLSLFVKGSFAALQQYIITFIIFLLGNDTLEYDTDNEKSIHQKWNHQIKNMSISIDNGTSNRKHWNHEWTYMQHVLNQMSDQQFNMNITTIYAHTITTYDSQLLNSAAKKFLS